MKFSFFNLTLVALFFSGMTVSGVSQNTSSDALTSDDKVGLILMREEEKLAGDVYASLYAKWDHPVFSHIMQSERRHEGMVKDLLIKFHVEDSFIAEEGQFSSSELSALYHNLVTKGLKSLKDAFEVGAMIEDLDISDLDRLSNSTQNTDIKEVYTLLNEGSQNHLRAFAKQLDRMGVVYTPQYISPERWESILSADSQSRKDKGHNSGGDIVKSCAGSGKGKSCQNTSGISSDSQGKTRCQEDQGSCRKKSDTKSCCK
jgi:hypothetical protein